MAIDFDIEGGRGPGANLFLGIFFFFFFYFFFFKFLLSFILFYICVHSG